MKAVKNRITLVNMISTVILQFVSIISGFIIPKILLQNFGSEVNGLVSSITQFLNYITLIEGGITGVVMANLYKPLYEKNTKKLSSIINTTNKFYKKIGIIFIIYAIALSVIYPIIFKTNFSFEYVSSLVVIMALSLIIQYMFSLTMRTLLNADKKVYIVSIVQTVIICLNILLTIIVIHFFDNIHVLKLVCGLLFVLQPVIYSFFIKKYYKIDKNIECDSSLLKSRWDGFAINFAAFIHSGTDITILTIFTNLQTVSIYSVYSLVSNGLKQIINSISTGINPTLGEAYAKGDIIEINEKMDLYEYIILILVFQFFTVGAMLITPFVLIYTRGINDANYNQNLFGVLLLISEAIYLLKYPHLNLSYSANKFKKITIPAFIESLLNIVISICLVNKFGIIGVTIGTIIAMTYRLIFHVSFTKKIIRNRNCWDFYRKIFIFACGTFLGLIVCYFIPMLKISIINWLLYAVVYFIIFGCIYLCVSIIFFKKELLFIKHYLIKKERRNL